MSGDNILVAVKSRPFIPRENREKLIVQWNIHKNSIFQIDDNFHRVGEPYTFDHVFTEENTNSDVYSTVVEPLIKSCLAGFNSTIFAYGQTSSGKTYTMMGTRNTAGIIQMAVSDIFNEVHQDKRRRYLIRCSYLEIYNEKLKDLLEKNETDLKIREDGDGSTFIIAKEEVVTTPEQVYELMNLGNKTRKIACNNVNERSSRSHTIFRFTIESTDNTIEKNGPVQVSQLNLVDLAGSERIAQTKAEGKRLQEGVNINKSLLVLGNVIRQLSDCERHISYRDSKLTRLLQQALGGNAKSLIIATITLAVAEETKSTLEFAQRAKAVKNKPVVNEILSEPDIITKFERITAGYKERLETEQKRIREMEVQFQEEKVEREREILKLKQQCKLIDKFTKGPQAYMSEIKVSRRHTVGHYGHRLALDPIPELTVAPSTSSGAGAGSRPETSLTASTQETYEEFLKLEDTSDSVLAEPIDDSSSSARTPSPEPAQYEHLQEEETPPSLLRKRLRSLEHSFTSLREFTRLEQECKEQEQEDSTQELVRQKERLMKDCSDLDAMLQSERQEKEILKLTYADNEASLKASIEELKEENTNLASKLAQIEAESEIIKVARGNELTDHQYELEERTRNYDQQLNHLRDEIQRLRNQTPEVEPLQQRITELVDENRHLTDAVIGKNQKIEQLVDQLSKKEECIVEGATEDILSISTQTENIETEADKDRDRTEEETARLQHETEVGSLVEKIKQLELDNELKAEKEQKLQAQLNEAHNVIKKLNEEIALEMEHSAFLNEERDIFLQEVAILTELLSLDDEQIVLGLIEEHQGLLDLYESLLKSYSDQIIIGYTSELDQFTICLQELDNITTDVFLKEKIETAFINIDSSPANFIFLLEEFSRTVSNAKYSEIMKKLNKLKADIKQKTNHVMYKELRNKQLQLKIGKQMQYLEQLDDLKVRIRSEKDKDQMTKTLEDKVKEYEKRIVELESTLDGVKHECAALIIDLEERGKEVDEGAKTSDADLQKIIDLTDETVSLRSQLVDLRSERDELTDQLKRLKKSIKGAKVELETEKAKNQELNTKLENLQSENIVSEKDKDQMIKTLEGKVKEYEKRIVELESTLDSVKHECAALRIDLEEREKEGDEGAKTSDADLQKIIDLTDETVSLRSQLVDLRSERDELTDQLKRLKKSIKGAKVELEAEKAKNQELNIKLENLQSEKIGNEKDKDQMITTLEDKVKEYEKRIVELESTLDSVKHECAVLKIDLEEREKEGGEDVKTSDADLQKIIDLTNETVSLRSQLVDLRSECDGLTDQLKRFKKSIKGTKVELETEKAKIQELNGKLENLQSENVSLIIKNCDLENQLKDMKSQGGYGLWKFSTATFTDEYVKDPTEGNAALQKEFDEMRSTILDLCTERDHLNVEITSLRGSLTQIQNESISEKENKNSDLNKKLKDLYLENMALTTRINDLENTVKVTRSTESLESRRSSSSSELSQKEIRRRKRQSLQDQRRGIDLEECGDGLPEDGQDIVEKELKEKIDKLTEKVTKLANDNNFLEDEIQGFIVELADARRYNSERLTEIQKLKEELEKSKRDAKKKEVSCDKCDSMENYIKRLEDLHKSCMYKKVDLQTQIYDLQNIAEIEKCNRGEVERKLRYENHRLKEKLGIDQPPEMEDSETQCNFLEYDALIAKYNNLKKVAKMRRTEGNILRGRLGMQPDEPVE